MKIRNSEQLKNQMFRSWEKEKNMRKWELTPGNDGESGYAG